MDLSPMQLIASIFGGGAGGGLITKGLDYLAKRQRSEAYTMGAVDHAVQTAMAITTARLEATELGLQRVEAQHEDCERNLRQVRHDLDETKRLHKAEIDRLMAGPIAGPHEKAPGE